MSPLLGQKVIDIANGLLGSHYINGGYGATPGLSDGCPCRPGGINLIADPSRLDPKPTSPSNKSLAVFAAEMKINEYCVCAGNYSTFQGGRLASPNDQDLQIYLGTLKGKPTSSWSNYYTHYTPRRAYGPGPGGNLNGKLVWGQSCQGIRHFDCVGFISYCYWKATGKVVQLDIVKWRSVPNPMGATVFDLKAGAKPSSLLDGDIVVQADHHIGYVDRSGVIIEAQDTDLGVRNNGRFSLQSSGAWTHLVRLPDPAIAVPAWLTGWWKVTWRKQVYYYHFDARGTVRWTQVAPSSPAKPPMNMRDSGQLMLEGPVSAVIRWNATGSVERIGLLPSSNGLPMFGGTWNGTEPIEAVKL